MALVIEEINAHDEEKTETDFTFHFLPEARPGCSGTGCSSATEAPLCAVTYSQHTQESHGWLTRPSNAFCSTYFALWTLKPSSNAMKYNNSEGPKTQNLWLS